MFRSGIGWIVSHFPSLPGKIKVSLLQHLYPCYTKGWWRCWKTDVDSVDEQRRLQIAGMFMSPPEGFSSSDQRIHSFKFSHGCHECCCIKGMTWNAFLEGAEWFVYMGTHWHSAEESINKGFQPVTCTFWVSIVAEKANWDCLCLICLWPFRAFVVWIIGNWNHKETSMSCCLKNKVWILIWVMNTASFSTFLLRLKFSLRCYCCGGEITKSLNKVGITVHLCRLHRCCFLLFCHFGTTSVMKPGPRNPTAVSGSISTVWCWCCRERCPLRGMWPIHRAMRHAKQIRVWICSAR